jgi:AraC family transcriptional regulator of adaptative response / DNA-3-methyladenine glycosylase II
LQRANALELAITGAVPSDLLPLLSSVRRMFDLSADPARIALALSGDGQLRPLLARRPGMRIPGAWDSFECSVRAILGQRITDAAAQALLARVVARYGEPIDLRVPGITHLFPSPGSIAAADPGEAGVVGVHREALLGLARSVRDGVIRFDEPSEEVGRALCALPGVGPWTAGYVALRGLGEPDAFPFADLKLRQRVSPDDTPLTPRALQARAESWRPFRGYAAFHLWESGARTARRTPSCDVLKQPVPVHAEA